jgi:hypothetical protein
MCVFPAVQFIVSLIVITCVQLHSAVAIPTPRLTPEHRAARFECANRHLNDTENTIRCLVFIDEKQFQISHAAHRVWFRSVDPTPIRQTRNLSSTFFSLIIFFYSLTYSPPRLTEHS